MTLRKWKLSILAVNLFLLNHITHAFLMARYDPDCYNSDNETLLTKEKCSWMSSYEKNLAKYRNFYANLLEEENQKYAVEIQELYNTVSSALVETDLNKKQRMLYYSMWLIEKTEDLVDFLLSKGLQNVIA